MVREKIQAMNTITIRGKKDALEIFRRLNPDSEEIVVLLWMDGKFHKGIIYSEPWKKEWGYFKPQDISPEATDIIIDIPRIEPEQIKGLFVYPDKAILEYMDGGARGEYLLR